MDNFLNYGPRYNFGCKLVLYIIQYLNIYYVPNVLLFLAYLNVIYISEGQLHDEEERFAPPYACDKVPYVRWGASRGVVVNVKSITDCVTVVVPKWVGLPLFSVIRFSEFKTDSNIFPLVFVVMQPIIE